MELLSIHIGKIQNHDYKGETWTTAYMKRRVEGSVYAGKLNLDGDEQYNKKFHGGEHRAILMYASSHYDMWRDETGQELPYGSFAENFTVSGLDEDNVCIGDIYQIGDTVQVQVAQPRQPCNQIYQALGIRGIVKKVNTTYRSGWYCRVLQEGDVSAGMSIQHLERFHPRWTITRAHQVMNNRNDNPADALALSQIAELEPGWRKKLARAEQS